ncbi:hypothetical protein Lbir_2011 [Legionella birminghamensis]|uniref:Uncharacterized protein n=2 Tax=Legionella birminghamensis TaxID=28083 RepID=A0A378IH77_9GAMM|nr:hypothetical protein Lbir_2011 [Legionella birminghamensis]STX31534.1 Uncharacterised protein [Legionella birminghamensis]
MLFLTRSHGPIALPIAQMITNDHIVIDKGFGNGQFLLELRMMLNKKAEQLKKEGKIKEAEKRARLIGITAFDKEVRRHACEGHAFKEQRIEVVKMKLPCHSARIQFFDDTPQYDPVKLHEDQKALDFLKELQNKVDFVFDTFGSSTYNISFQKTAIESEVEMLRPGM